MPGSRIAVPRTIPVTVAAVIAILAAAPVNSFASSPGKLSHRSEPVGEQLRGRIVYIEDGDTVTLLDAGNQQIKIRLTSIDAPESSHTKKQTGRLGQPYNQNATSYLASLVKGKVVDANCVDTDRWGRRDCSLRVDGIVVNEMMVREGWAWANMSSKGRYLRESSYIELQAQARAARKGLWAGANPVAPWEWRKSCWEGGACPN